MREEENISRSQNESTREMKGLNNCEEEEIEEGRKKKKEREEERETQSIHSGNLWNPSFCLLTVN